MKFKTCDDCNYTFEEGDDVFHCDSCNLSICEGGKPHHIEEGCHV